MARYLIHHGIKGQRWGVKHGPPYPLDSQTSTRVRRSSIKSGSFSRPVVEMSEKHSSPFAQFLSKFSKKVRDTLENSKSFKLYVGKDCVGELDLYKTTPTSLNVVWVEIYSEHNNKGYGTSVMKGVIEYARQSGCKEVTLEVPGNAPNARHIYEKLGFKEAGTVTDSDEDYVWGGLTAMKLTL